MVIVIAILATITIVGFTGIQNRAKASAAQQAASQAAKKVTAYALENGESFPAASGANGADGLAALGITLTGATTYQYSSNNAASPKTYCITATNNNVSYFISNSSPSPRSGGCPGHSQNGGVIITNLFRNPGAVGSAAGFGSWSGATGNSVNTGIVAAPWSNSGSAFRATWPTVAASGSGDVQVILAGNGLAPGVTYTVVSRVKAPARATSIGNQSVYAATGSFSTLARSHATSVGATPNQVITMWVTFTADEAAYAATLRMVQGFTKAANDSIEISDVIIYEGEYNPSINWGWGESENWVWQGTPHNSTSFGPAR